MIKVVRDLIDLFCEEDIDYCHWKSSQHLDLTVDGKTDLDVLVDKKALNDLKVLLPKIGFKFFDTSKQRSYPFLYDFLAYDAEADRIVHLHLHTRLNIGPKHHKYYLFPFEKEVLESSVKDPDYKFDRINYNLEFLLLVIRQSVKIRKRDYFIKLVTFSHNFKGFERELEWLYDRVKINQVSKISKDLFGFDVLQESGINLKEDFYKLSKLRKVFQLLHSNGYLINLENRMVATFRRWFREGYRIIYELFKMFGIANLRNRRSTTNSGLVFAFVGGDGSGKSSISSELYEILAKQMNCVHVYLGTGEGDNSILLSLFKPLHYLLHNIGILSVEGKVKSLEDGESVEKSGEHTFRDLLKMPWGLILLYDRYVKLKKLKKYIYKGYVVITDRYPQNEVADIFDGPRLKKVFHKTEQKVLTEYVRLEPDILFRFECSPKTCVERKAGEVSLEQAKLNLKLLQSIDSYNGRNSLQVDADMEYNSVIRYTMKHLFLEL